MVWHTQEITVIWVTLWFNVKKTKNKTAQQPYQHRYNSPQDQLKVVLKKCDRADPHSSKISNDVLPSKTEAVNFVFGGLFRAGV